MPVAQMDLAEAFGPAVDNLDRTVWDVLSHSAAAWPEREAVVSMWQQQTAGDEGADVVRLTYRELSWRARSLAAWLHLRSCRSDADRGSSGGSGGSGGPLAAYLWNSAEWAVCIWAAARLGVAFVPLDPRAPAEAARHLAAIRPAALVVQDAAVARGVEEAAGSLLDGLVKIQCGAGAGEPNRPAGWVPMPPTSPCRPELEDTANAAAPSDPALIIFTSGTTAAPKPCVHTHRNLISATHDYDPDPDPDHVDRWLVHTPSSHIFALNNALRAWRGGGAVVLPSAGFDVGATVRALARERCTIMSAVPTLIRAVAEHPESSSLSCSSLRLVSVAATTVRLEDLRAARDRIGARDAIQAYGMSEGAPVISWARGDPMLADGLHEGVGKALPGANLRVCGPGTRRILARGEVGELHIGGSTVISGYLAGVDGGDFYEDDAGRNWLATGDQASMDADGVIRILGRYKDLIIRAGENISPARIEAALGEMAGVTAQIVGIPDPIAGQVPVAVVAMTSSGPAPDAVTRADVFSRARALGPGFALGDVVLLREDLGLDRFPVTSLGKVRKEELRGAVMGFLASTGRWGAGVLDAGAGASSLPEAGEMEREQQLRTLQHEAKTRHDEGRIFQHEGGKSQHEGRIPPQYERRCDLAVSPASSQICAREVVREGRTPPYSPPALRAQPTHTLENRRAVEASSPPILRARPPPLPPQSKGSAEPPPLQILPAHALHDQETTDEASPAVATAPHSASPSSSAASSSASSSSPSSPGPDGAPHLTDRLIDAWEGLVGMRPRLDESLAKFADSITVLRYCERVLRTTGRRLYLEDVHRHDTVAAQAALLLGRRRPGKRTLSVGTGLADVGHISSKCWVAPHARLRAGYRDGLGPGHDGDDDDGDAAMRAAVTAAVLAAGGAEADIEDVIPLRDGLHRLAVGPRSRSFRNRMVFRIRGATSLAQARDAVETALTARPMLRTILVPGRPSGPRRHAHVILRPTRSLLTRLVYVVDDVAAAPAIAGRIISGADDDDDGGGGSGGNHDSSISPPPPFMFRAVLVPEHGGVLLATTASHSVIDAMSLFHLFAELDRLIGGATGPRSAPAPMAPLTPYRHFADLLRLNRDNKLARASIDFHVRRLRGISRCRDALWPPQRSPRGWMIGPGSGAAPGAAAAPARSGRIVCLPDLELLRASRGVGPSDLARAALAAFNVGQTASPFALFTSWESGRRWPFVPDWVEAALPPAMSIDGPTVEWVVNLAEVRPGWTVAELLRRTRDEQVRLERHAHAPWRRVLEGLREEAEVAVDASYRQGFVWDVSIGMERGIGRLEAVARHDWPDSGVFWNAFAIDRQTIQFVGSWDTAQMSADEMDAHCDGFAEVMRRLGDATNWGRTLGEVLGP